MIKEKLTEQQELFLESLFLVDKNDFPSNKSRLEEAARLAGYSPNTNVYTIMKNMETCIAQKVKNYISINAPFAAMNVVDILENPRQLGAKISLDTALQILDRAGIVKEDKVEVSGNGPTAIIILPSKNETT